MMMTLGRTKKISLVRLEGTQKWRSVYNLTLQISSDHPVNEESGMIVSLVKVDQWLADLDTPLDFTYEWEWLKQTAQNLQSRLDHGLHVQALELEDGATLWCWRPVAMEATLVVQRRLSATSINLIDVAEERWVYRGFSVERLEPDHVLREQADEVWRRDPMSLTELRMI